ncbi:MAG: transposase [Roseovarius sp.]|nr:transposase [Roseovarius sp.]
MYCLDKIHHDVKEQIPCGRKRVYRLMRANNICSCRPQNQLQAQPTCGGKPAKPELFGGQAQQGLGYGYKLHLDR